MMVAEKIGDVVITDEMLEAGMGEFIDFEIAESSPRGMLKKAFIAMLSIYASNLERDSINRAPHQHPVPKSPESISVSQE